MPPTRTSKFSTGGVLPRLQKFDPAHYRHAVLQLPSPIDVWLEANRLDAFKMDVFLQGYLLLDDVGKDQVLCQVRREILKVRVQTSRHIHFQSMFRLPMILTLSSPSLTPTSSTSQPLSLLNSTSQKPCESAPRQSLTFTQVLLMIYELLTGCTGPATLSSFASRMLVSLVCFLRWHFGLLI
jgi:hypothetical protein